MPGALTKADPGIMGMKLRSAARLSHAERALQPLQDLPLELLYRIADYLDLNDLENMRLLCREITTKLINYFSRRCFHTIEFDMNRPWTMHEAVNIVSSKTYRPFVRHVRIGLTSFVFKDTENLENFRAKHPESFPGKKFAKMMKYTIFPTRAEWAAGDFVHKDDLLVMKMLRQCFSMLQKSSINPSISTMWCLDEAFFPSCYTWELRREWRLATHGRSGTGCWHESPPEYILLIRSLIDTGFPVSRLTLGICRPVGLESLFSALSQDSPFQHLRHLELQLYPNLLVSWMNKDKQKIRFTQNQLGIIWMLSQAQQLESFVLDCVIGHVGSPGMFCDGLMFWTIAQHSQPNKPDMLGKIRHLTLLGHDIAKQMLLDFVRHHQQTLKYLDLWEIMDGKWEKPNTSCDTSSWHHHHPEIKQELFIAHGSPDFHLRLGRTYAKMNPETYPRDLEQVRPCWETAAEAGIPLCGVT